MTSPVDELRAAATKLRTLAEAAIPGPWDFGDDGLVWDSPVPGRAAFPDPVSGSVLIENAAYIATMHPGVAVALADWLAAIAATCERRDAVTLEMGVEQALVDEAQERAYPHALALARLLNGGGS